jgi:hypothetical protein
VAYAYTYLNNYYEELNQNTVSKMSLSATIDNITLTIGNTSSMIYNCANMTEMKLINMTNYIA